jgi:hypothetical protein
VSLLKLSRKKKEAPASAPISAPTSSLAPEPVPAEQYRKPEADLYTVLLVIALIAVLIGILFLYLEMGTYDFKFQGGPAVGMVSSHQPSGSELSPAIDLAQNARQIRPLHALL